MIRVANIRHYFPKNNEVSIRVDRSNKVLGNLFKMDSEKDRDLVCTQYEHWLNTQIKNKNEVVLNELRRIYKLALTQDVALLCWCSPKRCHADSIKNFIEKHLPEDIKKHSFSTKEELTVVQGDILSVEDGLIIHQVNNCGVMGKGLANQIRKKYPQHYIDYITAYNQCSNNSSKNKKELLGTNVYTNQGSVTICGLFAQDGYGTDKQYTSYKHLTQCLKSIDTQKYTNIYIPYELGCGLGGY